MKNYSKSINYNDKWVLYRDYMTDDNYTSIFVIAIKDGVIKYVHENNPRNVCYSDMNRFKQYAEFFINPIQMENPLMKDSYVRGNEYCEQSLVKRIYPDNSSFPIDDMQYYRT